MEPPDGLFVQLVFYKTVCMQYVHYLALYLIFEVIFYGE